MKTVKWILLIALIGLIFGQLASADEDGDCCVILRQTTDWTKECDVDQFDPALGTLTKVIVEVNSCGWQDFKLDSEDSSSRIFTVASTGSTKTTGPNVIIEVVLTPQNHAENLSADSDDAPDFIGNDSFNFSIDDCQSNSKELTGADMGAYIGVGTVTFETLAVGDADVSGGGAYVTQVNTEMESEVCVTYVYDPSDFCITGHKFDNKTGNGLPDWTIKLFKDGEVIKTTTTGTGGYYEFCDLAPGDYQVCEVLKAGWKAVDPICIDVTIVSENSNDNDFTNEYVVKPPCGTGCPWFIRNELYTASRSAIKEVDASKGILANDPAGSIVVNPESITIDPKYGTIEVHDDGSFVYDPTGATGLYSGFYVAFKYMANNGLCDAKYLGIAKIQIRG